MEYCEFKDILHNKALQFQIDLEEPELLNFYNYMELLIEWNKKINLTAIIEPEEIIEKHFIDSLSINKYIKEGDKMLDIGTGAGFPGIPLKISNKDLDITLIDSLNKRINFLNTVINNMKLKNISAIHSRAEDFKEREMYDIVTSRAVSRLNVLLEYMLPFVKVGGICICMKSAEIEEEIKEAKSAINILGGRIEKIDEICLKDSDIKRKIVIIRKIKKTPKKYPRKPGTPKKEPIM